MNAGLLSHINELRRLVWASRRLQDRYEAAVLLIDLYERMLVENGFISHGEEDRRH